MRYKNQYRVLITLIVNLNYSYLNNHQLCTAKTDVLNYYLGSTMDVFLQVMVGLRQKQGELQQIMDKLGGMEVRFLSFIHPSSF